jgi:hypothetical protein
MNTELEIVHGGRVVVVKILGADKISVNRGDLTPELQAYLLANKAAIIAAATVADPLDSRFSWERPGAAIWQDPDGGETAVQVLAHLDGERVRVRSLLDGREYEVHRDRLQCEQAPSAPRIGDSRQNGAKAGESGEMEASGGDMVGVSHRNAGPLWAAWP